MKQLFFFVFTVGFGNFLLAQTPDCDSTRYITDSLFDVSISSDIFFGRNAGVIVGPGIVLDSVDLFLDVYEPAGDTVALRPLVMVGFGGAFVSGTRDQVAELADNFARVGYVAVTFDYRVGIFVPNATLTAYAVMRAVHDLKAAIRYLHKTVAEQGNPYRIDTSRILVSGASAGAIAAIHAAYVDKESELLQLLTQAELDEIGGLEGNSGNPGYPTTVHGVANYSGAIGDTLWMEPGDVPIISFHDTQDEIVPFDTRMAELGGIPTGLVVSGSRDITARAENLGIPNILYTRESDDHVGSLTRSLELQLETIRRTRDFFHENVTCKAGIYVTARQSPVVQGALRLAPNPAQAEVRLLNLPPARTYHVQVFNITGQRVLTESLQTPTASISVAHLPQGMYNVVVTAGAQTFAARLQR